ncbi:hypothetical protein [Kitasatospora sp. CB01950]|uniref:hypothetical protein n=1 Tax=Kitasatospora sp. CB01950 TaxID=1703930 RepID=UPI00093CC5DA|nr:hypothetical protein [Kitasatospora sp. CB01950]OKJ08364.1 hypothetical protein AMK19_19305 [Kitasatospora sp. CB01950]
MDPLDAAPLLAAMDPLPYPERTALFARTVRGARPADADRLIAELAAGDWYRRRLSAFAAVLTGRADLLARLLTDRDAEVRGRAIRALHTLPMSDEAVLAAYLHGSSVVRHALRRELALGHRPALAARLLTAVRTHWGDEEAALLLPCCPPETVAAELPGLAHAVGSWSRLTKLHPDLVLDHLEGELAGGDGESARRLAAVVTLRPARVLDLLERHRPPRLGPALIAAFGALVQVDAERATALLADDPVLEPERWEALPSRTTLARIARADPPSLAALGRRWLPHPRRITALLRALPPSRRAAFLDAAAGELPLTADRLTVPMLYLLPRERRWAEVRRLRAAELARGLTEHHLTYLTPLLPPDEAWAVLLPGTRRPGSDDRSKAWHDLAAVAAHDPRPTAPGRLLDALRAVRNEPDPVRQSALHALSRFPSHRFEDAHADALAALTGDALTARDCSRSSRHFVCTTALGVLAAHPSGDRPALLDWALATVERLNEADTSPWARTLHRQLRRGQEQQVLDALRPALDREEHHWLLIALVRALGPRAELLPELDARLRSALTVERTRSFSDVLELWLRPRRGRAERVLTALELDPSAAFFGPVHHHLSTVRTDLLDTTLLADVPPTGRFPRNGEPRPPLPTRHAGRWLPRQAARAGRLLASAAEPGRPHDERARAIRQAAQLPEYGSKLIRRHIDDPNPLIAEEALAALPWTDDPAAALPLLLEHAGDDRARVALYAAGRAARHTDPARLAELLTGLAGLTTGTKVTARKEAVRLAARFLPAAQAAELVAAAFHAPGQHPDVRAAAASRCHRLLDTTAARQLLAEAAADPQPQVREAVLATAPRQLAARHRPRYAELVSSVATGTGSEQDLMAARVALTALPQWARYLPAVADPLPELVTDLGNRGTWRAAATALRALADSDLAHPTGGTAPGSLNHRALTGLLAAEAGPPPGRDLPARQRLAVLTDHSRRPVLLAQAEQLAGHHDLLDLRAELLARAATPARAEFAADLARLADALADRPLLAARLARKLAKTVAGPHPLPVDADAAAAGHVRALAASGDTAAGLLAAALAARLGTRSSWSGDWPAVLADLRAHADPEVRAAAREQLTVLE